MPLPVSFFSLSEQDSIEGLDEKLGTHVLVGGCLHCFQFGPTVNKDE